MKVVIPDLVSNSYFPAIVAVEMGFFKQEGLDAELELIYPVQKCYEALRDGTARATVEHPLRSNAVHTITRENTGPNIGYRLPIVHWEFIQDWDGLDVKCVPKGSGSENMSFLKMCIPADGVKGIKQFVLESIVGAGGKPCPPGIVGVGIGGSADYAMALAKDAIMRTAVLAKFTRHADLREVLLGTGDATIMLAQQMAREGRDGGVTWLDRSAASLGIARARAAARGLTNIVWEERSLLDLPGSGLGPSAPFPGRPGQGSGSE